MAKISLKKKAGGTKVGNLIRKVAPAVKTALKTKTGSIPGLVASVGSQVKKSKGTGLVDSQGRSVAVPKIGSSGVNINKALNSGGLKTSGTGLTDSRGRSVAVPNFSSPSGVNINNALNSGGLRSGNSGNGEVLGDSTDEAFGTQRTSMNSLSGAPSVTGSALGSPATSIPSTNVINTQTLGAQNSKITLPEQTVEDYSKYIPAPIQPIEGTTENRDTALQDYMNSILNDAPDSAEAYEKAQRETGILEKQKLVNDLTGQLNAIVNRGQANQLAQVGQGRGIPEAIIGGIQAQIGRETAIAALPIQAQLDAAQGNLEMANDNLDTLFKIYSDDATREYERKKEVKKLFYDVATEKEKRALEKADKLEERAYQETQDLNEERSMYAKMAFETGQPALGAKIAKLDYKSPTFRTDLANLSSKIVDSKRQLEIQKLQQDLANAGTTINPKILATTQFKNAQAAQNLKLTLEKAKAAVQKYGNREVLNAEGKGILDSLKVQLRSEISTALEQGVVQPGEAAAFDSIAGQLNKSFFIRNKKTLGSLNSLLSSMDNRVAMQKAALTNTYNVNPEQIDTLLNITDLSDQEFADMDALID